MLAVTVGFLLHALLSLQMIAYGVQCFVSPKHAYSYLLEQEKQQQERLVQHSLININTASAGELATLNGIGVKIAEKIVLYRHTMGQFQSVDDLLLIKGIGEKTLAKNRHRLTVTDE